MAKFIPFEDLMTSERTSMTSSIANEENEITEKKSIVIWVLKKKLSYVELVYFNVSIRKKNIYSDSIIFLFDIRLC